MMMRSSSTTSGGGGSGSGGSGGSPGTTTIEELAVAEKKLDRLLKRAKIHREFLNTQCRLKSRLSSLLAFLDGIEKDKSYEREERLAHEGLFFRQYRESVLEVVEQSFEHYVAKITTGPKIETSITSAHAVELLKAVAILKPLASYCAADLQGSFLQRIVTMVQLMLGAENHPTLRLEGYRMLLAVLCAMRGVSPTPLNPSPELVNLFRNALPMQLFVENEETIKVNHSPIITAKDSLVIVLLPGAMSVEKQIETGLQLLDELFTFITKLAEGNKEAEVEYFFDLLLKHYFTTFFAKTCMELGLRTEQGKDGFWNKCPVVVFCSILRRFQGWLNGDSPADQVIKKVIFGSEVYLALMHEIMRQSLLLPFSYSDLIHTTISIYRNWMTSFKHQRPSFQRDATPLQTGEKTASSSAVSKVNRIQSTPVLPTHTHTKMKNYHLEPKQAAASANGTIAGNSNLRAAESGSGGDGDKKANFYLRMYVGHLSQCFSRSAVRPNDVNHQVGVYRQILAIFRSLSMDYPLRLEKDSWESLLDRMLEITEVLLNNQTQQAGSADESSAKNEMSKYLIQTLFTVLVRSMTRNSRIWTRFRAVLSMATRWPQIITQWANTMKILTGALALYVYGVDLETLSNPKKGRRQTHRPRSRSHSEQLPSEAGKLEKDALASIGEAYATMRENRPSDDDFLNTRMLFGKSKNDGDDENGGMGGTPSVANSSTGQTVYFLWCNVLTILGNVNSIKDPITHAEAVQSLVQILNDLFRIRDLGMQIPLRGRPVPPIYAFVEWFFQAAELSDLYAKGRATAYGGLCKLFCRRNDFATSEEPDKTIPIPKRPRSEHVPPEAFKYLEYFYRLLFKGWASNDPEVHFQIVRNCTQLFVLDLPGATMLIPTFIRSIKKMIVGKPLSVSDEVRLCGISILCTLIGYPHLYGNTPVVAPNEDGDFVATLESGPRLKFIDVRNLLHDAFASLVLNEISSPKFQASYTSEAHGMLLGGLAQLIFQELCHIETISTALVDECLNVILESLKLSNAPAVNSAVDALSLVIQCIPSFEPHDAMIQSYLTKVVHSISLAISANMATDVPKAQQEEVMPLLFYLFLDCISLCPASMSCQPHLIDQILECIERTLDASNIVNGSREDVSSQSASPASQKPSARPVGAIFGLKDLTKWGHRANKFETPVQSGEFVNEGNSLAKEAARHVLLHVLHFLNNFPSADGPDRISSSVLESHDSVIGSAQTNRPIDEERAGPDNALYFSVDDTILVSLVEVTSSRYEGKEARMIIRDCSGRYTWDSYLFFQPSVGLDESPSAPLQGVPDSFELLKRKLKTRPVSSILDSPKRTYVRQADKPPTFDATNLDGSVDMLDELLQFIESTPEWTLPATSQPQLVEKGSSSLATDTEKEISSFLGKQIEFERAAFEKYSTGKVEPSQQFEKIYPSRGEAPLSPVHRCRQLLTQLLFLNRTGQQCSVRLLQNGKNLQRMLAGLDKQLGRDMIKVGVLYVGQGQDEEIAILKNDRGSPDYDDLINGLGWDIDVSRHAGYLGSLEVSEKSGMKARYYCTPTLEVIYHVATLMPTDWEDSKQIKKKRHVGNDPVHIVWNEHYRRFAENTMRGDFGEVQIILTPMPNTLYCVEVYRNEEVPFFGPVVQQVVVDKKTLATTVRVAAISAHRRLRRMTPNWITPYENRQRLIDAHLKKPSNFKAYEHDFEDFFRLLFLGDTSYIA